MRGLLAIALVGSIAWFLVQPFERKVIVYLAFLPFVTWLEIHVPFRSWSLVSTGLLAVTVAHAVAVAPAPGERRRPAWGLGAIVLAYAGLAAAQAFNPALPSALLGVRGARLFLEPIALFFVGAEVARRPDLRRQVVRVMVVVTAVVVAYALKQAVMGFDAAETRWLRQTFPIALRERRVFGTVAGASVLGHYAALAVFLAVARTAHRSGWTWGNAAIAAAASFVALTTGQRAVILGLMVGGSVAIGTQLARTSTRTRAAHIAQAAVLVVALGVTLVVVTPVQDRREAQSAESAFDAARIKLAQVKQGTEERSLQLRLDRFDDLGDALSTAPLGAGSGLNLLIDPERSRRATALGTAGFGGVEYEPPVPPIPGELYYYTVGSELGGLGLAVFAAIALFAVVTSVGVAVRHPDASRAMFGSVAAGFLVFCLLDAAATDNLASPQVAAWFWLFVGITGRWGQEDREPQGAITASGVR